jgi:hypothetical protein
VFWKNKSGKGTTHSGGCVHGQHTLRFVKGKEASLADFVLVKKLCRRFTPDSGIYAVQLVEKDHNVPLRIDKAHKNTITF